MAAGFLQASGDSGIYSAVTRLWPDKIRLTFSYKSTGNLLFGDLLLTWVGLVLAILLPQPPEYWDGRCVPLYPSPSTMKGRRGAGLLSLLRTQSGTK